MWSVCSDVRGCHTSVSSDQRLSRLLVLHQRHSGYQLSRWRGQEEEGRRWARECVRVCAGVRLFTCAIVLFGGNGIFQVHMYKHTTHINTLCDDGQPQDPLLTLPAWKAQMERTQRRRINDRCVWVCVSVCMCNMGVLNQTSSFRNPCLFNNSVSLESYLRRQFMHALLIIYTVMLDQCCMHGNRGVRGFSQVLYVYVCVRVWVCMWQCQWH